MHVVLNRSIDLVVHTSFCTLKETGIKLLKVDVHDTCLCVSACVNMLCVRVCVFTCVRIYV